MMSFAAGRGPTFIGISSTDFADIDGGHGYRFASYLRSGDGLTLDIRAPQTSHPRILNGSILTGSGDNTLVLDRLSVLRLSEDTA